MIYVASSWRNPFYDGVVAILPAAQLPLYDFKHPKAGHAGFHWHAMDPALGDMECGSVPQGPG